MGHLGRLLVSIIIIFCFHIILQLSYNVDTYESGINNKLQFTDVYIYII